MLDLFFQVQEKVKEAYGFQGPSLGSIVKPIAGATLGGGLVGGLAGGLAGVAASGDDPEGADATVLKGVGAGALGGAALGALGGAVAKKGLIGDYRQYKPIRNLMNKSEALKRDAINIARQVDDEADPDIAADLKNWAWDLADQSRAARDEAVHRGVRMRDKVGAGEDNRSILDRIRGKKRYHYLFGKRIGNQEAQNIAETLQKKRPRTEAEQQIQDIVGARPTRGQIARAGLIGATGGIGTHLLGSAIEGGNKWLPDLSEGVVKGLLRQKEKRVLHPRSIGRAAAVGGILAGAVPVAKQLWDIQTARERPEAF